MPIFTSQIIQKLRPCNFRNQEIFRFLRTSSAEKCQVEVSTKEDPENVEYPPIYDLSIAARRKRKREEWYEDVRSKPTVEQKLYELNIAKYYGWYTIHLKENRLPYGCLPFIKYATRTHVVEGLPQEYSAPELEEKSKHWVEVLAPQIEEQIVYQLQCHSHVSKPNVRADLLNSLAVRMEQERTLSRSVITAINRTIMGNMCTDLPYLQRSEVDIDPRNEAFWFLGGLYPDKEVKRIRKIRSFEQGVNADDPIRRPVQFLGNGLLQVRCENPQMEYIHRTDDPLSCEHVEPHPIDPRVYGIKYHMRHGTSVPGFWPGDICEFGLLSYHPRDHLLYNEHLFGHHADHEETVTAQGILASYAWCLAQAGYQGFNTYNELSYPLTTQTVITDGQTYSFHTYQLNTSTLYHNDTTENPLCNVCWKTPQVKLYEKVEGQKLIGFDKSILSHLIKMYLREPVHRDERYLKTNFPDPSKPHLAHQEYSTKEGGDDRREWLHKLFRHMYANRPRHVPKPEIYHWESIYKVRHQTLPMDSRRRWFEMGRDGIPLNPGNKRYDDYKPLYIRRSERLHKSVRCSNINQTKEVKIHYRKMYWTEKVENMKENMKK